jgi:hypothetical protein
MQYLIHPVSSIPHIVVPAMAGNEVIGDQSTSRPLRFQLAVCVNRCFR